MASLNKISSSKTLWFFALSPVSFWSHRNLFCSLLISAFVYVTISLSTNYSCPDMLLHFWLTVHCVLFPLLWALLYIPFFLSFIRRMVCFCFCVHTLAFDYNQRNKVNLLWSHSNILCFAPFNVLKGLQGWLVLCSLTCPRLLCGSKAFRVCLSLYQY